MVSYTAFLRQSLVDYRWWSTLLPGWLLVAESSTTSPWRCVMCSTGCQSINRYYTRLLLPPSNVSMALARHTSGTFARRSPVSGLAHLCSAECRDMPVPRTRTELGRRSFQVAAPTVCNSLLAHLGPTYARHRQFRDGLKSHLFTGAYFWSSENMF